MNDERQQHVLRHTSCKKRQAAQPICRSKGGNAVLTTSMKAHPFPSLELANKKKNIEKQVLLFQKIWLSAQKRSSFPTYRSTLPVCLNRLIISALIVQLVATVEQCIWVSLNGFHQQRAAQVKTVKKQLWWTSFVLCWSFLSCCAWVHEKKGTERSLQRMLGGPFQLLLSAQ